MGELYTAQLRGELSRLAGESPSFVVSLCSREEPPIQSFRGQIEDWFARVAEEQSGVLRDGLTSQDNGRFFHSFSQLALHEILRYHDLKVERFDTDTGLMAARTAAGQRLNLFVASHIPEVQIRASIGIFRHLVQELQGIEHRYSFSVYLKRWLPFDFDPRPIKRALEAWLNSLDEENWKGKYAEYRDEYIHLEFSILDRLEAPRKGLVRFRITPLLTPEGVRWFEDACQRSVRAAEAANALDAPLVAVMFSNEDWNLPPNYLRQAVYGKAGYNFNWTTHGGRREFLNAYTPVKLKGIYATDDGAQLSALLLCDKEWERDRVVFSLRAFHNPWATRPLGRSAFAGFAQYYPLGSEKDTVYMGWEHPERARFHLP